METLSEHEIAALARAFPPVRSAAMLLDQAGIPLESLPNGEAMTSLEFWWAVSRILATGIVPDGRRAVIEAAHRQLPYNDAFLPGAGPIRSVLVVGASPAGASRLRADRELKAILEASAGQLAVHPAPAALAADLEQVLSRRPDVLHLACHGDGQCLLFEDQEGRSRLVPAELIAGILNLYRDRAGVRLRGVVLNACQSAGIAPLFASAADVVIAHEGPLDDGCAVIFAGKLYKALAAVPALAEAAEIAAGNTVLEKNGRCGALRDNLRVIMGAG